MPLRACRLILMVGLPALLAGDILARPRAITPPGRRRAPGAARPGPWE